MVSGIHTIGQAVRHGMLVRVECRGCGNMKEFDSSELMMRFGGGRDPFQLKFRCRKCTPAAKVTLHEQRAVRQVKTIGDMIAAGESLYVNCHDPLCQSSVKLNLEALAQHLGRDHEAMHDDLVRRFRCARCKAAGRAGRGVGFTCIPNYRAMDAARMTRPVK